MSGTAADLAVVVLAHRDPEHLGHLLTALAPLPVVVHVDAKVAPGPAAELAEAATAAGSHVALLPRRRTDLASWSLVAAELDGLAEVLRSGDPQHVAVMSGCDYPLLPVPQLLEELAARPGTRMWNTPMPYAGWDAPRHRDGGMWRLTSSFITRGERVVHVRGVPLRWPSRRQLPPGLVLRGGSQWKVYSRDDAQAVLDSLHERPDVVQHWRTTLVPDETFVPTVLASRPERPLVPQDHQSWFMEWHDGAYHPEWLTEDDVPALLTQRDERERRGLPPLLFARKVSSGEGAGFRRAVDELVRRSAPAPGGRPAVGSLDSAP